MLLRWDFSLGEGAAPGGWETRGSMSTVCRSWRLVGLLGKQPWDVPWRMSLPYPEPLLPRMRRRAWAETPTQEAAGRVMQ